VGGRGVTPVKAEPAPAPHIEKVDEDEAGSLDMTALLDASGKLKEKPGQFKRQLADGPNMKETYEWPGPRPAEDE
jgi:hypothetical protein